MGEGGFSGSSAATSGDASAGDKNNGFNVNYGATPWYAYAFASLVVGGLLYVVITK
jgi:hypothetical protein